MRIRDFNNNVTLPPQIGSRAPGLGGAGRFVVAYELGQQAAISGQNAWDRPGLFAAAQAGFPIGLAYLEGYLSIQT